jgi:hypothetical protein
MPDLTTAESIRLLAKPRFGNQLHIDALAHWKLAEEIELCRKQCVVTFGKRPNGSRWDVVAGMTIGQLSKELDGWRKLGWNGERFRRRA